MSQFSKISAAFGSSGRAGFPDGFLFGTASSAYQYEGAVPDVFRGECIWDTFTRKFPERNSFSHGNQAIDFYHRYKEDIKRMKDINMDSFRFSISWVRILPHGKKDRGVNEEGIRFYSDLIDCLLENGITPLATLFHWDVPQVLEDEYGGFLSEKIVDDFRDFAEICFEEYGDRVKLWITINEPWVFSIAGYDTGRKAPGRGSKYMNDECVYGNSGHEAYIVSHNLLLAHAEAVHIFKKCENCKDGKIGLSHNPMWFEPYDPQSPEDKEAAQRAMEFMFDWHLYPTMYGDYPETMKTIVGKRLPSFTKEQSEKLKIANDFVGINYYTTICVKNVGHVDPDKPSWKSDTRADWRKVNKEGKLMGAQGGLEWLIVNPDGLRKVLSYVKNKYGNPTVIITENGYSEDYSEKKSEFDSLMDIERIEYHRDHLQSLRQAIYEDGVRVVGYFAWSLMDNFEWNKGYECRFGLYYTDYKEGLRRCPKMSAMWFKDFLKKKSQNSYTAIQRLSENSYYKKLDHQCLCNNWFCSLLQGMHRLESSLELV